MNSTAVLSAKNSLFLDNASCISDANIGEIIKKINPIINKIAFGKKIKIAREKGLKIPIIYNSNGYERVETLKNLKGLIDVYLPDLKYSDNELGLKYSKVPNYFEIAQNAIKEMEEQVRCTRV